jgi:hypothetical protein
MVGPDVGGKVNPMNTTVRGLVVCAALAAPAAGQDLPFTDGKWDLGAKGAKLEQVDGRDVLTIENGIAWRRDVQLQDGTIEFDVQVSRRRSFVYLWFRIEKEGELEEFYLRPQKSGLPDALQYAPVFQGQSQWQLYHGEGGTAAVEFEPGAWTHVRVVLQGPRAALFIGPGATPAMVPKLAREPRAGFIALRSFLPPDSMGQGPIARFANVRVAPGVVGYDFASAPAMAAPDTAGVVKAWSVSRAFLPRDVKPATLPGAELAGEFRRLNAAPGGLVELHRHVSLPAGSRAGAAVARIHVRAATAGPRAFDLGFSDRALVFLNGRPLFDGEASYSFDKPRREGLIGYDQARLWLPLQAGDNELAVVISDGFGGWGLMGRFADPSGLEVEAR